MKLRLLFIAGFFLSAAAAYAGAKFIDADTLEVTAKGIATKSASPLRDGASCKEAARNEALRIAIETLVDMKWPNVKGKVSRKKYGDKVTQTTKGTIQGGHVIASHVDAGTNPVTCTVTLRISRMNPDTTHRQVMQSLAEEENSERLLKKSPGK